LSRVINPESSGKERLQLTRLVALAVQQLMRESEISQKTRDLAAFITLALEAIAKTIDVSVTAWEKRGYWLKADRFRMEWEWSERLGQNMRVAVLKEDWGSVAAITAKIAEKLGHVQLPKRGRKDEFWVGAWEKLNSVHNPKG
jgi:hypothetical protein